ncbi:hypothetical protein GUJ93_ZPchr0007g4683 [Zizania palustris]|uniref:Uncharacterized protein n=1 Tax=Zizania palustris TaxID=103762 RepID=A0A8J5W4I7_ZIZPA|nr:hypothetical protein GUJ93_ZPchr0007g4683 [Zizania palustris]
MEHVATFFFGVSGNVIALFLFMSPVVTFWRIIWRRSTENFSGVPYNMTLLNCLSAWYGLPFVSPNNILVTTINGTGSRLVMKTKSVEFMPFLLSLSVFLCGTSWFVYGLLGRDPFIAMHHASKPLHHCTANAAMAGARESCLTRCATYVGCRSQMDAGASWA